MDYKQGFKDAVDMFGDSIEKAAADNNGKIDGVIETLRVAMLKWEMLNDEDTDDDFCADCEDKANCQEEI